MSYAGFCKLISALDESNATNDKVRHLQYYFVEAPEADKIWALALFTGKRPKRTVKVTLLRKWAAELAGIDDWLFEECYHTVGDLAETISLLLPENSNQSNTSLAETLELLGSLAKADDEQKREVITTQWQQLSGIERFVFNKLITGGFRIGVSKALVTKGLAKALNMNTDKVTHLLSGDWQKPGLSLNEIFNDEGVQVSRPYPFYLAYPIEPDFFKTEKPEDWQAEWKWDGIRGQLIKRNNEVFLWSRGEELITEAFPDIVKPALENLPDGTVLDGEILVFKNNEPEPFQSLQTRIGRKTAGKKILSDYPCTILCYDLLELAGEDLRPQTISARRVMLEKLIMQSKGTFMTSPVVNFNSWEELSELQKQGRSHKAEGLMLKRLSSAYEQGRKKGNWWKWKLEPFTVDAIMIYAQSGHGRRANLFTDFTFAVWDNGNLVPFTKAYSGLSDKEMLEVDAFVKKNTIEKFGPVRSVKAELVFELAFEGIQASKRHKCGLALRFPRIIRWRKDKPTAEADSLDYLKGLLENYADAKTSS